MENYHRLLKYDSIGNVPYFPQLLANMVRKDLGDINNIQVQEDEHAIYVKVENGKGNLVVIETHLDHPGYVINTTNQAVSIGTVYGSEMLNSLNISGPKPVEFYTKKGEFICDGELINFQTNGTKLIAQAVPNISVDLCPNTQVLPKVKTGLIGDLLHLRSVDNLATTFVCLNLIRTLSASQRNLNFTFIFSKLEEVFQITATGIALLGRTPFDVFNSGTIFVVLEAAPIYSGKIEDGAKIALANSENGIPLDPYLNNQANSLLLKVANNTGIDLEIVNLKSHSDAISYSLVGKYPNVSCLLVNSTNRHNIDEQGNFAPEIVNVKSLEKLETLLLASANQISNVEIKESPMRSLSDQEQKKSAQLIKSYLWARQRLISQKLYPENMKEKMSFLISSVISHLHHK